MTSLKKIILAPFALAALAVSAQTMAATQERHTVQLEATIPSQVFHVQPVDGSWLPNTQVLNYNPVTETLETLRKQFFAKHTAGTIEASLLTTPELQDIASPEKIALQVSFNNTAVTTTPVEVVNAAESLAGITTFLEIKPTKPVTGYKAGIYEGNVQLAFDAVVPTP
ncbi:CS1 type fimbrial major subunit [compost metagenome]